VSSNDFAKVTKYSLNIKIKHTLGNIDLVQPLFYDLNFELDTSQKQKQKLHYKKFCILRHLICLKVQTATQH